MKKRLLYQCHVDFKDRNKGVFGHEFNREQAGRYWDAGITSAKFYCKKYSIDYKLEYQEEETYKPYLFGIETFDKYKAIRYLKDYDQVLYVDTDVLIKANAGNIFDECWDRGFVGWFDQVADKFCHTDSNQYSGGKINSGVLLFNRNSYDWNERSNFRSKSNLYKANIWHGNEINEDTPSYDTLVRKYGIGYWWQYWEQKYHDEITYLKNKKPSDENLFHRIVHLHNLFPFHIGRKYNWSRYFEEGFDDAAFIHYIGPAKEHMMFEWERKISKPWKELGYE